MEKNGSLKIKNFFVKEKILFKKDSKLAYLFSAPYIILFIIFIIAPIIVAIWLSFTDYDMISSPTWAGLRNYVYLLTTDVEFMKYILPNTITFAFIVGPCGYVLSFFLAWVLSQFPRGLRTVLAVIIYSPSLTAGVTMSVVWKIIFAGDAEGYLNNLLLSMNLIAEPIIWLQSTNYLLPIMIIVALWSSMGLGFLSMLAGILSISPDLYEAAYMDGIKNRFQEIIYITIPSMKPQMLFGAVMSIVGTFSAGAIGVQLSGSNPTPQYAGSLIVNHIEDYAFQRYDMGYAAALSVFLLALIYLLSKLAFTLFGEKKS